jgi:hypothetical protein
VVWGNSSESEIRRMQIAQNKATRIVLWWRYDTSLVVMYNGLGWSSINKIIEKHMLILFYTVHHITRNRLSPIDVLSRQRREIGKITFQFREIKKLNNSSSKPETFQFINSYNT